MRGINRYKRGVRVALCAALLLAQPTAGQERYQLQDRDWLKQTELDPVSPEGQLQTIRKLLAQDQPGRAKEQADQWIERYPNHPLLAEAYLLRGDARVANRDYYKALFDYETLLRSYPASEEFFTALEREYHVAMLFASGVKRKLWGMPIVDASGEAEELLIRIQERAPGSAIGEKASLALGDFYFDRAKMNDAAEAYDLFLQNYPRSAYRERVMLQLIRASLATFKGPRFDATGLLEAQVRIRMYQQEYPAAAERLGVAALLVRIDESLALKNFYNGRWYEKTHKPVSAVYMYQRVVADHPQTAAAQLALDRLARLGAPSTLGAIKPVPNPESGLGDLSPPASEPPPPPPEVAPDTESPDPPREQAP